MTGRQALLQGQPPPASGPLDIVTQSRRLSMLARVVLIPVAGIGAVLSFRSLYLAAVPTFGPVLAAGFPALVDLLILGSSLQYVAGAKLGHPMIGWRLTAHAGVAATLALNALAAHRLSEVPWHITAPAVWAVLVELAAKQVMSQEEQAAGRTDAIALTLWITAPKETLRTRMVMHRTGITDAPTARIQAAQLVAAREAVRLALPPDHRRRTRTLIYRQLRSGALAPAAVLPSLGWDDHGPRLSDNRPEATMLAAVLRQVLASTPGASLVSPEVPDSPREQHQQEERPQPHGDLDDRPRRDRDTDEPDRRPAPDDGRAKPERCGSISQEHQRRLDAAIQIFRLDPTITGRSLATALRLQGWNVSDRTASRVLPEARRMASGSGTTTTGPIEPGPASG